MRRRRTKSKTKQYLGTIGIALVIAIILRTFVVQGYRIPSGSMENALLKGDFVLVNKLAYRFGEPKPGDIIVFDYPLNPSKTFIKRIIVEPGETVEIINKTLCIDGEIAVLPYPVKHTDPQIYPAEYSNRDNFGPFEIPPEHYFVMGDNRDNSRDSREWGFLERKYVKGKAFLVYFSWAPDSVAPKFTNPYITSFFEVLFYNLVHFPWRVRWERIGTMVR
ncbi:MAG: signal peptidase I [candidate division Zixibacteria bacterium]|nr:signal peptidase I [candidate division Zixibacteria bacterium]